MSSERVQALLGISREDLDAMARQRQLLRVTTEDGIDLFPVWQFDQTSVLSGLSQVLVLFPERAVDGWTVAGWLQSPDAELENESPLDALHRGKEAQVLAVARAAARTLGL